jgi:hypothetical protein
MCSIVDIGKGDYFFKYREQLIGKNVEFICSFFEERNGYEANPKRKCLSFK